jgi:hypothetical protein
VKSGGWLEVEDGTFVDVGRFGWNADVEEVGTLCDVEGVPVGVFMGLGIPR